MKINSLGDLPPLTDFPKPGEPDKPEIKLEKPKLTAEERERDQAKRFEQCIGKEFDRFPKGSYSTSLKGIKRINLVPYRDEENKTTSVNIVIPFGESEKHVTFQLFRDGALSGRIPEKMGVTRDEIYDEILRIAESLDISFFEMIDDSILPAGTWPSTGKGGGPDGPIIDVDTSPPVEGDATDPNRIKFIRTQPGALFGFVGIRSGFNGYCGFVFGDRLVLDSPLIGNAVYVFKHSEPIEIKSDEKTSKKTGRLTSEQRRMILDKIWTPISELSKQESLEAGAARIVHPPKGDIEWEAKMLEVIRGN